MSTEGLKRPPYRLCMGCWNRKPSVEPRPDGTIRELCADCWRDKQRATLLRRPYEPKSKQLRWSR